MHRCEAAADRAFTQEDPIGIAGGLSLYGYANGDPVNFSDPFGLRACCEERTAEVGAALGRDLFYFARDLVIELAGRETGSELGADFVEHFFEGNGDTYVLTPSEFNSTATAVGRTGVDQSPGTRQIDFYGTDLAGAYGRATGTFDQGGLVGIRDRYDFNPGPLFGGEARPWTAEFKTRLMNFLGGLFNGRDFEIRGGSQ